MSINVNVNVVPCDRKPYKIRFGQLLFDLLALIDHHQQL